MVRTWSGTWAVALALAGALALAACGEDEAEGTAADQTAAVDAGPAAADSTGREATTSAQADADAADPGGPVRGSRPERAGDDGGADGGSGSAPGAASIRYTAQVGAFAVEANADALEQRLEQLGLPVWRSVATVDGRRVHRVRVGAATDAAEARRLRAALRAQHLDVWLAPLAGRRARGQVPDGALAATRDLLRTS